MKDTQQAGLSRRQSTSGSPVPAAGLHSVPSGLQSMPSGLSSGSFSGSSAGMLQTKAPLPSGQTPSGPRGPGGPAGQPAGRVLQKGPSGLLSQQSVGSKGASGLLSQPSVGSKEAMQALQPAPASPLTRRKSAMGPLPTRMGSITGTHPPISGLGRRASAVISLADAAAISPSHDNRNSVSKIPLSIQRQPTQQGLRASPRGGGDAPQADPLSPALNLPSPGGVDPLQSTPSLSIADLLGHDDSASGVESSGVRRNVAEAHEMSYAASLRDIWAHQNQVPIPLGPTNPLRMYPSNPSAGPLPHHTWGDEVWHRMRQLLIPASRVHPHVDATLTLRRPVAEAHEHRAESADIELDLLPSADARSDAGPETSSLHPHPPLQYSATVPEAGASALPSAVSAGADEVQWWSRNDIWESRPGTSVAANMVHPYNELSAQQDANSLQQAWGYPQISADDPGQEDVQPDDAISSIMDDLMASTLKPSPRLEDPRASLMPLDAQENAADLVAAISHGDEHSTGSHALLDNYSYDWSVNSSRADDFRQVLQSPQEPDSQAETTSLLGFQSPLNKSSSKHYDTDDAASVQLPLISPEVPSLPLASSASPADTQRQDSPPTLEQVIVQTGFRPTFLSRSFPIPSLRGLPHLQRPLQREADGQLPGQLPDESHPAAPSRFWRQQQHPQQPLLAGNAPAQSDPHAVESNAMDSSAVTHGRSGVGHASKWPWRRKGHKSAVAPSIPGVPMPHPQDAAAVPGPLLPQPLGWAARRGFERLDSGGADRGMGRGSAAGPLSDAAGAAGLDGERRPSLLARILSTRDSITQGTEYRRHRSVIQSEQRRTSQKIDSKKFRSITMDWHVRDITLDCSILGI